MKTRLCIALTCLSMASAMAQEVVLRHQLDGPALDVLATQVVRFNDSLKGRGKVILQDARGLEDKRLLPHLALLDPADSMEFFDTRPRFLPLHQVLRNAGQRFDSARLYPQVLDAIDDASGKIQALPLGLSLPVLLTNRALLTKAGVDVSTPPQTWMDLQKTAGAVLDSGIGCPLTSSRFAWLHIENVLSQQGEPMVTRSGRTERVNANSMINVKHLALLASWQKSQYFHYAGPALQGDARFLKGECAMLTGSSSLYVAARRAGIDVGMSRLPYDNDAHDPRPADILPDGMSVWTLAGHKAVEYKLAARFMVFLTTPDNQKEWVKATSFLPMTPAAVSALRESGIPASLLDAAEKRLSAPRKGYARLKHGPVRDRLHEFLGEEVALVWTTTRAVKDALDTAVRRATLASSPPAPAPATKVKAAAPGAPAVAATAAANKAVKAPASAKN